MACMKDNFVKGQLLDCRFRTIAPLNHGSFGMVFLAEDTLANQEVAIKCSVKQHNADSAVDLSSEEEELHCHQLLQHDHLVNLVHHFETQSHRYLVLEYCSQGDLYEAIRLGRGPLQTEHVRDFMLQLVDAVDYMHSKGIYHRDVKPENIFLTQDGIMKLGDFGLATMATRSFEPCVGSDRYMAPEQYSPSSTGYSPAQADIWSVGICLLNVLFSRNPFATPTESDILFADFQRDRQSLFDVFPNMSRDTFEILSHSLAIDPEKRSLTAVRNSLSRAICFTTDDELLDDFCTEERDPIQASANREPLRTPSLQSPALTQAESFPWAKALHSQTPLVGRQLSAIPDNEGIEEDLFPGAFKNFSKAKFGCQNTPSSASVLDSGLGASFESAILGQGEDSASVQTDSSLPSGSLPTPSFARPIPSVSMIFGAGKSQVSKSWNDLWEEGEDEAERANWNLGQRRDQESRSFSQDGQDANATDPFEATSQHDADILQEQSRSAGNFTRRVHYSGGSNIDQEDSVSENGFVVVDHAFPAKNLRERRAGIDKWAELGIKRRNGIRDNESFSSVSKRPMMDNWRKSVNLSMPGDEQDVLQRKGLRGLQQTRPAWLAHHWRRDQDSRPDAKVVHEGSEDDLEWVGGWHAFHL